MFNGTADPNGLNNPRAPWPVVQGAAGHYDGLDQFANETRLDGSIYSTDQCVPERDRCPSACLGVLMSASRPLQSLRLGQAHLPRKSQRRCAGSRTSPPYGALECPRVDELRMY